MHKPRRGPAKSVRTISALLTIVLVLALAGVGLYRHVERRAFGARADTEFKVSLTAVQVDEVNQVSSGSDQEPITVTLRDSYATGPQEWSLTVTSVGPDIGALNIKIMDPDPNNKI